MYYRVFMRVATLDANPEVPNKPKVVEFARFYSNQHIQIGDVLHLANDVMIDGFEGGSVKVNEIERMINASPMKLNYDHDEVLLGVTNVTKSTVTVDIGCGNLYEITVPNLLTSIGE